jgi:hypothetical protein
MGRTNSARSGALQVRLSTQPRTADSNPASAAFSAIILAFGLFAVPIHQSGSRYDQHMATAKLPPAAMVFAATVVLFGGVGVALLVLLGLLVLIAAVQCCRLVRLIQSP